MSSKVVSTKRRRLFPSPEADLIDLIFWFNNDRSSHTGGMEVAVVGEGAGMFEDVFKSVAGFVECFAAVEEFSSSSAICSPTSSARRRVGFLGAIAINPDDAFSCSNSHDAWGKV